MTDDILEYARQFATDPHPHTTFMLNQFGLKSPTEPMKNYIRYDLEVPEDTHWELVKMAADLKMHHEDYVQNMLVAHVEQHLDNEASARSD